MSVLNRKQRLSDRIPTEVRARARAVGTESPNWYVGRLEDQEPHESTNSPEGNDETALRGKLAEIAQTHRGHGAGRDLVDAGIMRMHRVRNAALRLLHLSHP